MAEQGIAITVSTDDDKISNGFVSIPITVTDEANNSKTFIELGEQIIQLSQRVAALERKLQ